MVHPAGEAGRQSGAAGFVGVLITALFALKPGQRAFDAALDVASISAAVFTVASAYTGFATFLRIYNPRLSADPIFGQQLGRFLVRTPSVRLGSSPCSSARSSPC